jgi:hypothetical protein
MVPLFPLKRRKIPDGMITWPGGQLAECDLAGRRGKYHKNITRYEKVFEKIFGKRTISRSQNKILHFDALPSCPWKISSTNRLWHK